MAGQMRRSMRRVILAGTGLPSSNFQLRIHEGRNRLPSCMLPLAAQQQMMVDALRKATFSKNMVQQIMNHHTTHTGLARTLGLPGLLSVHVQVQLAHRGTKLQAYTPDKMYAWQSPIFPICL